MIEEATNDARLIIYLNSSVNSIFKILPLYEEKNFGIKTYVESLLFELSSLDKSVRIDDSHEYISLLNTLESIKIEVGSEDGNHSILKREIFKCINIVKNMVAKLEKSV